MDSEQDKKQSPFTDVDASKLDIAWNPGSPLPSNENPEKQTISLLNKIYSLFLRDKDKNL